MQNSGFHKSDYYKFLLGVLVISFSPFAVKLVSFDTSASAFYRSFYAAIFFFIFSLLAYKTQFKSRNKNWVIPSIIAGIFLGIDLTVWHKTIIYLGAGIATFLGNSQILFVTIFAALVFRDRIPTAFYIILGVVMAGLYLMVPSNASHVSQPRGYFLGLIVGLTYAGMLICLRYAKNLSGKTYPELLSLCLVFIASAATVAGYILVTNSGNIMEWDARSHIVMAITGLMCQTIGWYLINNNMTKIPAHEASLFLLLQPLLATIWGALFFLEGLNFVQIFGITLTLGGITLYQTKYASKQLKTALKE